jgi:hypothetical protein
VKYVRDRRARRAVLLGLALFVAAQVALAAGVGLGWLPLRDPDHALKVRLLRKRLHAPPGQRPLVVVQVGSSRTVYGLRGQVAEPWLAEHLGRPVALFNMGIHGAGPMLNRVNLERLFNAGVRPDLVLIEVLPALLTNRLEITELLPAQVPASRLGRHERRLLGRLATHERPHLDREWWSCQLNPCSAYRFSILTAASPNLLGPGTRTDNYHAADNSGWLPLRRRSADYERRALARAEFEYRRCLKFFRLSPRVLATVRETVLRCRKKGVRPALVLMPEGPTFRSWYPHAVREQIDQALAQLGQECGVPLLDLRDCVGEDGFVDSHHLYPEGATLYTRRLAERIVPLLGADSLANGYLAQQRSQDGPG